MQYDIQRLELIPIDEVVEALGGSYKNDRKGGGRQFNMKCCNSASHKEGDNNPSMTVWVEKNICKCHACGIGGNPISIAKTMHGSFKIGCEWLHDVFNIPLLEGELNMHHTPLKPQQVKEEPFMCFNKHKGFRKIDIEEYIPLYETLTRQQQLKLVYTYIYKFSLKTERKSLISYYESRGIIDNPHLGKIGFLSAEDITKLIRELEVFPLEDLIEFAVINDANHKFPLQWRQLKNTLLVPAFDIYSDLVEGFMLRPIDGTNAWFKGKESRLSVPSILKPLPFGIGYKILSGKCDIYITEGHVDALSLPSELCFIAAPGVQSFEQKQLGVLSNRNIVIAFDQDEAGQKAAWGYTEISFLDQTMTVINSQEEDLYAMIRILESQKIKITVRRVDGFKDHLLKAGVESVTIKTWDPILGKDVNELLKKANLKKVF